jgi:hypothetical protein
MKNRLSPYPISSGWRCSPSSLWASYFTSPSRLHHRCFTVRNIVSLRHTARFSSSPRGWPSCQPCFASSSGYPVAILYRAAQPPQAAFPQTCLVIAAHVHELPPAAHLAWVALLEDTGHIKPRPNGAWGSLPCRSSGTTAPWCWAWFITSCLYDSAALFSHHEDRPPAH